MGNAAAYLLGKNSAGRDSSQEYMDFPNDEVNPENMTRRDSLWHGVGFRFREGGRQSLPLRVSDLQLPKGRHSPLTAVPVHKGWASWSVSEMSKTGSLRD